MLPWGCARINTARATLIGPIQVHEHRAERCTMVHFVQRPRALETPTHGNRTKNPHGTEAAKGGAV